MSILHVQTGIYESILLDVICITNMLCNDDENHQLHVYYILHVIYIID